VKGGPSWSACRRRLPRVAVSLLPRHGAPPMLQPRPRNHARKISPKSPRGDCLPQTPAHRTAKVWLRGLRHQANLSSQAPTRLSRSGGSIRLRQGYGGFRLRPLRASALETGQPNRILMWLPANPSHLHQQKGEVCAARWSSEPVF
jgi:hypothetical protein